MTDLMGECHDGLVLPGLDVVVDEGDKCCVVSGNSFNFTGFNEFIVCTIFSVFLIE